MNPLLRSFIVSVGTVLVCAFAARAADPPHELKSRHFQLSYGVSITGLSAGETARLWMPVPPNNDEQSAHVMARTLPGPSQQAREKKYGNDILYVEAAADAGGQITARTVYDVKRREARASTAAMVRMMDDPLAALFLKPDARVPIDGKPLTLLSGKQLPMDQLRLGRTLYDIVNSHMRYSKEGTGWGLGDSVWACDSRYGNCSDFHSLFISLARSQGVPAKFEIGFPVPDARGRGEIAGYHCWAWFQPKGHGWVPVDISEADKHPEMTEYYFGNLTENRITFSMGRDLVLEPAQAGPPLNFFVMPYVEVAGKQHPPEKVKLQLQYEDVGDPS